MPETGRPFSVPEPDDAGPGRLGLYANFAFTSSATFCGTSS